MKNIPDPPAPADESSLEEVRKRLQSFGYLNNPIGRFYLGSLTRTASQFLNRCFLSFRTGLLTGTIAAFLMSAGTLAFNVELLRNKFDLVLLFLYFEIFFVFLFSVLELLLIYLVALWTRFAGGRLLIPVGQIVSLLTGLAFFGYFFSWGRSQISYLQYLSTLPVLTMVVILTLSCIFVAKCTWLGFLVAFQELEIGRHIPNWRRYGTEVLLSLAAVIVLIPFVVARSEKTEESSTPVAVLSTNDRWMVIGIDGISSEILQQLEESGSIPFLRKLSSDSFLASLQISQPVVPPVSWTTIATGVPPAQHGIFMPEVRRWGGLKSWMQVTPLELAFHSVLIHTGFGQRQPVSGYLRKTKTFWEILSDTGTRVGVVNWWGSWPARQIRGWNISERYYYKIQSHQAPQNEAYPAALFQKYASLPTSPQITGPDLDRFYAAVFAQQMKEDPVRVAALYLPGLDILNYEFFEMKKYDPFSYTDLYRKHLAWIDEQIGKLREVYPDYRLLLVFHQGRSLVQAQSAVMILQPNETVSQKATIQETDIAPLILYSCGVPVSRSMSTALIRLVTPTSRLAQLPLRFVDSYPKHEQGDAAHPGEFNELLIEQMKSLGYLQ